MAEPLLDRAPEPPVGYAGSRIAFRFRACAKSMQHCDDYHYSALAEQYRETAKVADAAYQEGRAAAVAEIVRQLRTRYRNWRNADLLARFIEADHQVRICQDQDQD